MAIKIIGTGCYIPENITSNQDFLQHEFYQADGTPFTIANESIIEKFQSITGIAERKYAKNHHNTSDLATLPPSEQSMMLALTLSSLTISSWGITLGMSVMVTPNRICCQLLQRE